jgi:hypothetical protein
MRLNKNMRNIIYDFTNGCNSSKKYQLVYGTRTLQLHSRVYTILRKSTRFDFSKCSTIGKTGS